MYGNPFSSFSPENNLMIKGRRDLLHEIAQIITLSRPDHKDIHGLPEMGKSTLLRYIAQPEFIEAYREHFLGDFRREPHRLFILYVSGWLGSVHPLVVFGREFYRHYDAYRARLRDEHQTDDLPDLDEPELADHDGDQALEVMEPHIRQLVAKGVRPVFLLDEFDREHAFQVLSPEQAGRLSTWMAYCSFIFATERLLEKVNPSAKKGSPLFKRLQQTFVREYIPEEAAIYVVDLLKGFGTGLPDKDIDYMAEQSGGFPTLLLLAGRALWDMRQRMKLPPEPDADPLSEKARAVLTSRLAAEFKRPFNAFYQAVDLNQRQALIEQARQEEAQGGESPGVPSGPRYNLLSSLEQYGLIQVDDDGVMRLFAPLFRAFLLQQEPTKPAKEAETGLTGLQANLYHAFVNKPDAVLTFDELGEKVWGRRPSDEEEKRRIHIAVSKLRKQLEESDGGGRIISQRSLGYRFVPAR